jgi:DNA-binding MarR family transcriptional regulator
VDAADRRVARVQATANGTRFLQRNRTRRNAFLAARLRKLSAEDLAAIQAALPVMEKLLEGER